MLSPQEIESLRQKYNITSSNNFSTEEGPSYISRVGSSLKREGLGIGQSIVRGSELIKEGIANKNLSRFNQGVARAGLGSAAGAVRTAFTPITEAVSPVLSPIIQKFIPLVGEENIQKVQDWAQAHPDAAANLQDVFDIATTVAGAKGASSTVRASAKNISAPLKNTGEAIKNVSKKAFQQVDTVATEAARIPSRIGTNLAEKSAKQSTIRGLPTDVAKRAAQDGIDVNDVKFLYKVPSESKKYIKELADVTKKFSEGSTKKNPIEIVGKPIVERIKELNKQAGLVGKNLGDTANTIGNFTSKEITPALLSELKKVPGLNGIRLGKGNKLIFSDTVLSDLSKSDKTSIQKIFTQAAKPGTGKSKHLLRQELFEILGGKKKSLQAITDTQDKAFQAIRKALSDVLETKNPAYKKLSNDYRKIIQPLQDMKKLLKVTGDEDILNMSAGLLARRLTSNAASNPQIRAILRAMDKAVKGGKSQVRVETLQDVYNILNKYYDISGKTSFQGQVKAGIESAKGIGDVALQAVKGIAGETPAVRQKALEAIFKEIFN